jgi:molybdate transport system substrate-binding protein
MRTRAIIAGAVLGATGLMGGNMAETAEIKVMASMAFKEAYLELVPVFEKMSEHKVTTTWAPSSQMITRLKGDEAVDLVIMAAGSIDELIKLGKLRERTDLAKSGIGVAVRAGAPKPDISSGEAVKRALLNAKSVAYSTGPSGIYLSALFERMGIADQIKSKVATARPGEPVGEVVARGDAEIGFQQMSELLPVKGIDLIGPLPADIQEITVFSAGLHAAAKQPDAAKALVRFLTAPEAAPVIKKKGMEPG